MTISRKQFLDRNKEPQQLPKNISVHSQGLPEQMLNREQQEYEDVIYEVPEEEYVEEVSIPVIANRKDVRIVQNPTQADIQAMQLALAQTIHNPQQWSQIQPEQPYVPNMHTPVDEDYRYVPPPPIPPQEQYMPQTQVFQQFSPPVEQPLQKMQQFPVEQEYQEYNPPMRSKPPQQDVGYTPQTSEQARHLEIKASFEDPRTPLYIINLTTQALFFTNLYGSDTKENECTMGTVDNRDPSVSHTPYMIIPSNKKPLALQHEYFVKYIQKGYIKVVTRQEFQNFAHNYNEMLNSAIERKNMIEQISQQSGEGMISVQEAGIMGGTNRNANPQYMQYMQHQAQRGPMGTEIVNVMGGGNELVNPYDIGRQQSIQRETGIAFDPESSWGELYSRD